MLRSLDEMRGFSIQATDGEIGHVEDFYFDDMTWTIRYLVVDTGPWLFGREVLVSPVAMGNPDWDDQVLPVDLSREQVKNSPDVDLDQPVSRQHEEAIHAYYGWSYYWLGMQTPGAAASPAATPLAGPPLPAEQVETPAEGEEGDPRLRSAGEVINYTGPDFRSKAICSGAAGSTMISPSSGRARAAAASASATGSPRRNWLSM